MSCMIATLTFLNVLTVATHGIVFDIPDEGDFRWGVDPVGQRLLFMSNFSVSNHGAFDIRELNINAWLENSEGVRLIDFRKEELVIAWGGEKTFDIMVELPVDRLSPAGWLEFLSQDDTLRLFVDIDADYMFGLIHMTVDEVIEYPWEGPLKEMMDDDFILAGLATILDLAERKMAAGIEILEPVFLDFLSSMDELNLALGNGAELALNVLDIDDYSRELACSISAPIGDGQLDFSILAQVEIRDGRISAELKEVRFSYVAR